MHYRAVVVIPCFNEEKRLDSSAFSSFAESHPEIAFILYNDGSTDGTERVLELLAAKHPESFFVESALKNSGKAEAVRCGILSACAMDTDIVGFWDADLATPLCDIVAFAGIFDARPEIQFVTGARLKRLGCDVSRKISRHYMGRIFATLISMKLRLPVYDSQCGAKLMRHALAEKVFTEKFVTKWFFDVEILRRLIALEGREKVIATTLEQPVSSWRDVGDSKVSLTSALFQFVELLFIKCD
ncbi:MAG: glycosyltransferase [Victivallaceae bacterium]|nr:glycosyltransferase [Victivallaceae bacterium]